MDFEQRAGVFLRAAELIAGPWRDRLNAATMVGQSKTVVQAEIDVACELADFLRFNVHFAERLLDRATRVEPRRLEPRRLPAAGRLRLCDLAVQLHGHRRQPRHGAGDPRQHRGLETGDDGVLSNWRIMQVLREAGLPDGVINFVPGDAVDDHARGARGSAPGRRALHRLDVRVPVDLARSRPSASTAIAPIRAWSARPAARTSCSRTRARTPRHSPSRWCAAPTSTRARSAARPRVPTCRRRCGPALRERLVAGDRADPHGRPEGLPQLHGCGHRPARLRPHPRPPRAATRDPDVHGARGRHGRRGGRLVHRADAGRDGGPDARLDARGTVRPGADRVRLRRRAVAAGARTRRPDRRVTD